MLRSLSDPRHDAATNLSQTLDYGVPKAPQVSRRGRAPLRSRIKNEQPFVFVLTMAPRIEAGDPIPAGTTEVSLFPQVKLGF